MHQEHSSMLSEELSLLTIDLFLKGKKPKQTPSLPKRAVTSAAEVTACFRNHPTSHQSCAGVKRELERSHHLPVILSKEAAAPGGSTSTEPGHWPTHPLSENLLCFMAGKAWKLNKGLSPTPQTTMICSPVLFTFQPASCYIKTHRESSFR